MTPREKAIKRLKQFLRDTNYCLIGYPQNEDGYVYFQYRNLFKKKENFLGHRLSYEVHNNVLLSSEDIIRHTCDNPSCINPLHLKIGTHADNVADRVKRSRSAIGKDNGRYKTGYHSVYEPVEKPKPLFSSLYSRKLTEEEVKEARSHIKNRQGRTLKTIGEELNIPYTTMRDLSCGRIYKDV